MPLVAVRRVFFGRRLVFSPALGKKYVLARSTRQKGAPPFVLYELCTRRAFYALRPSPFRPCGGAKNARRSGVSGRRLGSRWRASAGRACAGEDLELVCKQLLFGQFFLPYIFYSFLIVFYYIVFAHFYFFTAKKGQFNAAFRFIFQ